MVKVLLVSENRDNRFVEFFDKPNYEISFVSDEKLISDTIDAEIPDVYSVKRIQSSYSGGSGGTRKNNGKAKSQKRK